MLMFTKILVTYQMKARLEGFQVVRELTLWPNYV